MKKIITREEKGKKETRNKVIIGLVLVAIMVLGTLGYAFFSGSDEETEKIEYNGIEFTLKNGMWQFELQGGIFSTQYNPKDAENISVPIFRTINNYYEDPLYFIGQGPARQEIERNLWGFILRPQDGCIESHEDMCEENAPMKNCSTDNIIIIKETNYTEILQEENCIFISSPYEEQARTADAFLFKVLGIKGF